MKANLLANWRFQDFHLGDHRPKSFHIYSVLWLGLILALACLAVGCFTRTVYVSDGKSVRLRATIRNAKVWVMGADGKPVPGVIDIPEGWYAMPDPGTTDQ